MTTSSATLTCSTYSWDACEEEKENRNRSVIRLNDKEGGPSTYYGHNNSRREFITILIDGCIIPKGTEDNRCDYLLLDIDRNYARLIELKGSEFEHGMVQLEIIFQRFKKILIQNGYRKIEGRLVCTKIKIPSGNNTPKHKKIQEDLYRRTKLFVSYSGNGRYDEDLDA